MRKRIEIIVSLCVVAFFFSFLCSCKDKNKSANTDVGKELKELMAVHEKYMNDVFNKENSGLDNFDKFFFSDFTFLKSEEMNDFFQNVQEDIEKGKIPEEGVPMEVTYSSYSEIDGKKKSVNYKYLYDGKTMSLTKQTDNNGKVLKAIYDYDIKDRLLKTQETEGDRVLSTKTHKA